MNRSKYLGCVAALTFAPMVMTAQRAQETAIPLKNWATPLYWQPSQTERSSAAQIQFSPNAVSNAALTFVAITPCRLVDTRGAAAGFIGVSPFSGPSIASGGTITIPVQSSSQTSTSAPAPCGAIPSNAQAYSLNLTLVPHAGGPVDFVTMWPAGGTQPIVSTLNDQQGLVVANAAIVPAGTPSGGISLFSNGPSVTDVIIDMNGYFAAPSDEDGNTALGMGALPNSVPSSGNTAMGVSALGSDTSGGDNTAAGGQALLNNTTGQTNTAIGASALFSNTSGGGNTASGGAALRYNTVGFENTADGVYALQENTTGNHNVAVGDSALFVNTTGSNNIGIGTSAGYSVTGNNNIAIGSNGVGFNVSGGNSNNIHISSPGTANDNGTIRIGTATPLLGCVCGPQTSFFAAGIRGVTTGNNDAIPVMIDSNGQLGTVSSSRRFKEDIQDMGDASSALLHLRPVTFRYKQPFKDGLKPVQYGLIAEEVAEVYPDLVAHSADGQVETVKYQLLDTMLLNELQKQSAHIQVQDAKLQTQTELIRALDARLAALEAQR